MEEFVLLALNAEIKRKEKTELRRNLRRLRDNSDPFSSSEREFYKYFRFGRSMCRNLIEELEPHDNQRTTLPFTIRVLATLYFFGHGSYQKCVGNNWFIPMSQSTVSRTLHEVAKLIIYAKGDEVKFPQSVGEIAAVKTGSFGIKGAIGAIDCTHVAIVSPPANNIVTPLSLYMNRKGFYSINVEAVCDHQLIFTSINAKFPGASHDSGIWTTSIIRTHLMRTYTGQEDSWLLGDQGYPLEPWLLTPLSEPQGAKELKYNKLHVKSRNTIERAFGVLKSRFRCLSKQRVLYYSHERAANIIYACGILHNILVKHGVLFDINQEDFEAEPVEFESSEAFGNTHYLREGQRIRSRYISSL